MDIFKTCKTCNQSKEITKNFQLYKKFNRTDLHCWACRYIKHKPYLQNYNLSHKKVKSNQARARHEKDPRVAMLANARWRANKFGFPFDITVDDIIIPTHCPILGIPLKLGTKYPTNFSPSLDKINPEKGYVKGNIAVLSFKANKLKSDLGIEAMERVLNYMKGRLDCPAAPIYPQTS